MNHELPDVQAGFIKGRGTRDQIPNICWVMKKARESQKNIYFCFIDYDMTLLEFVGCDHLSFFICPKGGFLRSGDDRVKKGPGGLLIRGSEYVALGDGFGT